MGMGTDFRTSTSCPSLSDLDDLWLDSKTGHPPVGPSSGALRTRLQRKNQTAPSLNPERQRSEGTTLKRTIRLLEREENASKRLRHWIRLDSIELDVKGDVN